jgi:hypothetical protein
MGFSRCCPASTCGEFFAAGRSGLRLPVGFLRLFVDMCGVLSISRKCLRTQGLGRPPRLRTRAGPQIFPPRGLTCVHTYGYYSICKFCFAVSRSTPRRSAWNPEPKVSSVPEQALRGTVRARARRQWPAAAGGQARGHQVARRREPAELGIIAQETGRRGTRCRLRSRTTTTANHHCDHDRDRDRDHEYMVPDMLLDMARDARDGLLWSSMARDLASSCQPVPSPGLENRHSQKTY